VGLITNSYFLAFPVVDLTLVILCSDLFCFVSLHSVYCANVACFSGFNNFDFLFFVFSKDCLHRQQP
jgi:hypothetical protein